MGKLTLCLAAIIIVLAAQHVVESKLVKSQKNGKTCKEVMHKGCKVEKGECVCGRVAGCESPFPYNSHHQCSKDLQGNFNKCRRAPCENGVCVQIKKSGVRKWECSCSGSGYYGNRCQNKCPEMDVDPLALDFPTDCIY